MGEKNRKQRILDAALEIFASKGFEGARIDEIAKTAGVNKALLYYYPFCQMTATPKRCKIRLISQKEVAVYDCSNTVPAPAGEILSAVFSPAPGPGL
ncbi:TetR/AcrR family transcriptional regulator [Dehalococcoidia bacterium]|nr:TetR/AcrR family transcriptional regulator [Dehalococcoidia bacterium]